MDAPNGVVMEGYLFKRASNAFKTWNRSAGTFKDAGSLPDTEEDLPLCCWSTSSLTYVCLLSSLDAGSPSRTVSWSIRRSSRQVPL